MLIKKKNWNRKCTSTISINMYYVFIFSTFYLPICSAFLGVVNDQVQLFILDPTHSKQTIPQLLSGTCLSCIKCKIKRATLKDFLNYYHSHHFQLNGSFRCNRIKPTPVSLGPGVLLKTFFSTTKKLNKF
jgi:hypothetical protein